jgi:hypothetical protein
VVLASDNLTYLPTPQLTTREQPSHTKHLPASYSSRPYTIIAFLFFGAFRFRVLRESIENTSLYVMVIRGSAARGRTASEPTARETGESSAHQIDKMHASIPKSHVVTCKICWRCNARSPGNCSMRGASISAENRRRTSETRETSPITYHR